MSVIKSEDIKAGMVLAEDVKNHRGMLLLRAGETITEKNIRILKMWGVVEINIQSVDKKAPVGSKTNQTDPKLVQKAKNRAKDLFRHTDQEHPAVRELFNLCSQRIVRQLSKE